MVDKSYENNSCNTGFKLIDIKSKGEVKLKFTISSQSATKVKLGIENLDKIMDDVEGEVNHETHTGLGSTINNIYKSVKNTILSWFK